MADREHPIRDLGDLERRVSGIAALGTVAETDYERARVRVQLDDDGELTDWLPFATPRAQGDRTWHPPETGEQVLLVSPEGDLAQALVVGAVHRDAQPPPADRPTVDRVVYKDGTVDEYDRDANKRTLDLTASGGSFEVLTSQCRLLIGQGTIRLEAPAGGVQVERSG